MNFKEWMIENRFLGAFKGFAKGAIDVAPNLMGINIPGATELGINTHIGNLGDAARAAAAKLTYSPQQKQEIIAKCFDQNDPRSCQLACSFGERMACRKATEYAKQGLIKDKPAFRSGSARRFAAQARTRGFG